MTDPLALLAALQDDVGASVARTDPKAPVPACGDWRVRDLVLHLAGIHRWAAAQARREHPTPTTTPGTDPADLADHYRTEATALLRTLHDLGPDAVSWTLLGTGPARFWWRRQVHETLVHRHDLHAAGAAAGTDLTSSAVDPVTWADGVDEVVTMFQPRQVRLGRTPPLTRTVRWEADDVGRGWTLGAHEDGRRPDDAAPAVEVRGPARELDLLLWGRLTPATAAVTVTGDASVLDDVLATAIVP